LSLAFEIHEKQAVKIEVKLDQKSVLSILKNNELSQMFIL